MSRPEIDTPSSTPGQQEPLTRRLRAHELGALILGCVGLILGLLMVPRGDELLVMRVKGRNLAEAQRLIDGDGDISSRASVVAHGDVHLQLGDVDAALSKLEMYVEAEPDDAEAWERLAAYYRQAQRLFDYVRALEELQRLRPTPEVARELVTRYLWTGDERRELATLRALIDLGSAEEGEFLRAGRLAASTGDPGVAATILQRLAQRAPQAFDVGTVDLWANVLVDLGRAAQIPSLIGSLPAVREDATVLAGLAGLLRQHDQKDAAIALLAEPHTELDEGVVLLARLQASLGERDANVVFQEAERLLLDGKLPAEGRILLVESALSAGRIDDAWMVAEMVGIAQLPRWLRSKFVVFELDRGNQAGALAALARVGDDSLEDAPLMAAELAMAEGHRARAAEWIARFDARQQSSLASSVQAASLERKLGEPSRAFDRLASILASVTDDTGQEERAWALTTFVEAAREADRLIECQAALEATAWEATDEGRAAWVRVTARTAPARLAAWLSTAPALAPPVLEEVQAVRMDAGDFVGAHEIAAGVFQREPTPRHALMLGRTLLAMGEAESAIAALRVASVEPGAGDLLDAALAQAQRGGSDHAEEIRKRFVPALEHSGTTPGRLEFLVESLLAVEAEREVFPWLTDLAHAAPERWTVAFKDAAVALGRTPELHAFVATQVRKSDVTREMLALYGHILLDTGADDASVVPLLEQLSAFDRTWNFPYDEALERLGDRQRRVTLWDREAHRVESSLEDRRAAAFKLSALGAKREAISAFRELATNGGDAATGQLLFLWGPRPAPDALDWLEGRLRSARPHERATWMTHLVNSGASDRVLEVVPAWPVDEPEPVRLAWLSAARQAKATVAIGEGLMRDVLTYPHPDRARFVGTTALELGFPQLALNAWAVVASADPTDREANQWVGTLTFYEGDLEVAAPYLARYVALGGAAPEPVYQHAEVLRAAGDARGADRYYTAAIAAIDDVASPSFFLTTLRANALSRLGEKGKARDAFEELLVRDPEADDVRADYAALLMEWGDLAHAKHVLAIR